MLRSEIMYYLTGSLEDMLKVAVFWEQEKVKFPMKILQIYAVILRNNVGNSKPLEFFRESLEKLKISYRLT